MLGTSSGHRKYASDRIRLVVRLSTPLYSAGLSGTDATPLLEIRLSSRHPGPLRGGADNGRRRRQVRENKSLPEGTSDLQSRQFPGLRRGVSALGDARLPCTRNSTLLGQLVHA